LEHGAVTTKAGTDFNRRLEIIYDGIAQVLAQYHPDAVSVEKLYFSNNKTTGIGVAEARGGILLCPNRRRYLKNCRSAVPEAWQWQMAMASASAVSSGFGRPASVWRKPVASFCLRRRRPACLFLNTPPCR